MPLTFTTSLHSKREGVRLAREGLRPPFEPPRRALSPRVGIDVTVHGFRSSFRVVVRQELAGHFRLGMNRFTVTAEGQSVDVLLEFEF